jgi:hypothetical protein
MITGIGTPNNQSRIPRPIAVLLNSLKPSPRIKEESGAVVPRKNHDIARLFEGGWGFAGKER